MSDLLKQLAEAMDNYYDWEQRDACLRDVARTLVQQGYFPTLQEQVLAMIEEPLRALRRHDHPRVEALDLVVRLDGPRHQPMSLYVALEGTTTSAPTRLEITPSELITGAWVRELAPDAGCETTAVNLSAAVAAQIRQTGAFSRVDEGATVRERPCALSSASPGYSHDS